MRIILLTLPAALLLQGCGNDHAGIIEGSGTIEGTTVTVSAEVPGRIASVRVREGDAVGAGDTIALLDNRDHILQWRQARAQLEAAEAQLCLALEGSREEDLTQAKAALDNAARDYERMKELLASRTATGKQFDDAETRYIAARQTYEKLVRGLRANEIAALRARRDQASAQADLLRKKADDCTILAPSRGTVTLRAVEPGEFVLTGSALARLTDLDTVRLTLYVRQADLGRLRLGQPASVSIDTENAPPLEGTVVYISPVAEFTPKNVQTREERTKLVFAVRLDVPNPGGILKPGMPADAVIRPAER